MRVANSDYTRCSIPKARQNHCLPTSSAGNGQLQIWSMLYGRVVSGRLTDNYNVQMGTAKVRGKDYKCNKQNKIQS